MTELNQIPSRREVLKSISLVGIALTPFQQVALRARQTGEPVIPRHWNGEPLGRITGETMNARAEPNVDAEVVATLKENDVVRVRRVVEGQFVFLNNNLWLETKHGYLYSSYVQPMKYYLPQVPRADLGEGMWAEVIVPTTNAYWDPTSENPDRFVSRQDYSGVYYVTKLVTGTDGKSWYQVEELYQSYYMRATHMRIIPPEEMTPLSPDVDKSEKRIEVDLAKQTLIAFEKDTPVYAHRFSSGLPEHATPEGRFYIVDKRPGTRMIGGAGDDDHYNLPGIPFVAYFTWEYAAFHGAYWHNDYGNPRSHGCVNLPPYAAKWIWRWTTPVADYHQLYVMPETGYDGTKVFVGS
jgi:lipoprotein-anchoring transpeptidase ErfK/SrfK